MGDSGGCAGPLGTTIAALHKRNDAWRVDRRRVEILSGENAELRHRLALQLEVLEEKLMVIDTLTCTVDAMGQFEGPHSAPGFAKTLSMASGAPATPASPSRNHVVPAKRRSEMETIRRLQNQCLMQMQQIKLSDRAFKRLAHTARTFAMRVIVRLVLKWFVMLKLRMAWSRWYDGGGNTDGSASEAAADFDGGASTGAVTAEKFISEPRHNVM